MCGLGNTEHEMQWYFAAVKGATDSSSRATGKNTTTILDVHTVVGY